MARENEWKINIADFSHGIIFPFKNKQASEQKEVE
jgi:hypothetical protein